jgi:hypothetical protein
VPPRLRIQFLSDRVDVLAHVDERQRAHVAPPQFGRDRTPDSTGCTSNDRDLSSNLHVHSPVCCAASS